MTPRKFGFETVFDGEGEVIAAPPPRKTFWTAQEVEQVRAQALEEGRRTAITEAQRAEAACLQEIRHAIAAAMGALAQAAHDHRQGAAALAMAAARKIADAALDRFPEAPAEAALEALLREVEGHPRLLVRAPEAHVERMQELLSARAEAAGFTGHVTVKSDLGLQGAAFIFEWGEGKAAFDPAAAAERVEAALSAALAAEGLHAEPLNQLRGADV